METESGAIRSGGREQRGTKGARKEETKRRMGREKRTRAGVLPGNAHTGAPSFERSVGGGNRLSEEGSQTEIHAAAPA